MSSSADGSSIYSNVLVEIASDDIGDGDATFNKLITYYELMEMQGDLSPIDAKLKDYLKDNHPDGSSTDFQPLPLGTFILPEGYAPNDAPPAKKASCCLRLGTLSLEGEVGPPIKPMAVLKRIERADPSPAVAVGSKRQREDEQDPPAGGTAEEVGVSPGIESFSSWWGRRSTTQPTTNNKGTNHNSTVSFELVGVIKKRFHFKTKPTRQF